MSFTRQIVKMLSAPHQRATESQSRDCESCRYTLQILKVSAKVSLRFTVVSWGLLHVENLSCTCRGFGWGFLVEGFPKKPFINKRGYIRMKSKFDAHAVRNRNHLLLQCSDLFQMKHYEKPICCCDRLMPLSILLKVKVIGL